MYKILEIENGNLRLRVSSLGAIIMNLYTPDAKGELGDVVLGFDTPEEYLSCDAYLGALVGRVANRIANAQFNLDGKTFLLNKNEKSKGNHHHGGNVGFDKANWDIHTCSGSGWKGISCHYLSEDGQEGYDGNLNVTVTYKLSDYDQLIIEYFATTDAPTLCNLTQHSYFDLSAGKADTVLGNNLQVDADFYSPVDDKMCSTGEVLKVANTPIDLNLEKNIGDLLASNKAFFEPTRGLDHNFLLKNSTGELKQAGILSDPISGRKMTVFTTEPCIQVYTANFLNNIKGKSRIYNENAGVALETQHIPNTANNPHFPSISLYPKEIYSSTTVYDFGA